MSLYQGDKALSQSYKHANKHASGGSDPITPESIGAAPAPFKPAGKSYLTFSSPNSFTLAVGDTTKHWDGTLEYFSADKTWTVWDGTTTLSSVNNDGEHVLYLRGTGNSVITGNGSNYRWVLTGSDIACIGNIENLLDYAAVESGEHPTMASSCYEYMFQNCTSLTQAPDLPATTLAEGCYVGMFAGCSFLTHAPALPATTLAAGCYYGMFLECTNLKLSSTQTGEYMQEYRIPTIDTGTTATDALTNMFTSTGGTFTGTPEINTTYYLSSDNMVVRETEIATLNGYVGSMIDSSKPITIAVTLSASAWDSSALTQSVIVSGVLADETAQLITPTPALASQAAYYEAGILCTGQAVDSLTFTAKTAPTEDLTVYVVIQEVIRDDL